MLVHHMQETQHEVTRNITTRRDDRLSQDIQHEVTKTPGINSKKKLKKHPEICATKKKASFS